MKKVEKTNSSNHKKSEYKSIKQSSNRIVTAKPSNNPNGSLGGANGRNK